MLFLSPEVMQEAKKSVKERGIKTEDVKNLPPIEELCEPTTHPPMVEEEDIVSSPKKKKKHKEADNSNDPIIDEEPIVDPNSISISDAETEDGVEPDKDNEKTDPPEIRE
ncbi:hypothetical protein ZWY2020_023516 [Hordeum vulgare]|nr:hypothetical protein ZWY2020_023516 [Hordeum vulgare]